MLLKKLHVWLRRFKPDQDELSKNCSSSNASIDAVGFQGGGHDAQCSSAHWLPARLPSTCDVTVSLYALRFLIHRTFVLVSTHSD